jgi:hypothetical protein
VIVKVKSSKDNMKTSRHIKMRLKSIRNLRNISVITLDYINTAKNLADQCGRQCIYGTGLETHMSVVLVRVASAPYYSPFLLLGDI